MRFFLADKIFFVGQQKLLRLAEAIVYTMEMDSADQYVVKKSAFFSVHR